MADSNAGNPVRVVLGAKALKAEIILHPLSDPSAISPELCAMALGEANVQITREVSKRLESILHALKPNTEHRAAVAEARPPAHGRRGSVTWHVGPEADRTGPQSDDKDPPEDAHRESASTTEDRDATPVDHYERTNYTMVTKGQILATITPPIEGRDGKDVTGEPIPAKPGRPAKIKFDPSIEHRSNGTLVSNLDGVLSRSLGKWSVRPFLQIPDYVDFSTGNIDFLGDIEVIRGVRDCFSVRAQGNLEIQGLVEAADLHTGGDLIARGGVAARERGSIYAGGDLSAKYLDAARVEVGGTLRVAREIINCDVTVHDEVSSPSATLIGGSLTPTGRIRLATIGSPAGVATTLILATVPRLEPKLAESERLISQLSRQMESLDRASPEFQHDVELVTQLEQARERLRQTVESLRTVDIWVSLVIHHGSRLVCDGRTFLLREDINGPVTIRRTHQDTLQFRIGKTGEFRPLSERCDPDVKTAA